MIIDKKKKGFEFFWALVLEKIQIRLNLPFLLSWTCVAHYFLIGYVLPIFGAFLLLLYTFYFLSLVAPSLFPSNPFSLKPFIHEVELW